MRDPYAYNTPPRARRRGRLSTKLAATLLVISLIGVAVGFGTWSAFSGTTKNEGNSFATGTVTIADNDTNNAMFSLTGLRPGQTGSAGAKCIKVDYTGSLAANVRLYGSTTSGNLGTYLDVKVTRGTLVLPSGFDCSTFTADATEYISGQGSGVIYNGTLSAFPNAWATGIQYPASTWSNGTSAAYKFEAAVQDDNGAQGQNATGVTFTWEARNS